MLHKKKKQAEPLIVSIPNSIKYEAVRLPEMPKPLTGYKKAVADLKQRREENGTLYLLGQSIDLHEYAQSLPLNEPVEKQLFQATTDDTDSHGILKGDYFSGVKLNKFKWVENLLNPVHLFVIVTKPKSVLTQVLEYDEETGVISTCRGWRSGNQVNFSISDVTDLYLVDTRNRGLIKQIA